MTETQPVSKEAEHAKAHFESAINDLNDQRRAKLENLKTHLSQSPFVIGEENPERTLLVQAAADAQIPFPFIDFVILNSGIQSKEEKEEYLRSRHDRYFDSLDYPGYLILALSQELDLTKVYPEQEAEALLFQKS